MLRYGTRKRQPTSDRSATPSHKSHQCNDCADNRTSWQAMPKPQHGASDPGELVAPWRDSHCSKNAAARTSRRQICAAATRAAFQRAIEQHCTHSFRLCSAFHLPDG